MSDGISRLPRAAVSDRAEVADRPASRINDELERHPELRGFLEPATERLIAITDEMTAALGIAAVKIAKARGGTAVDVVDVSQADEKLNQSEHASRVKGWLFGIGCLLLGGAFSNVPIVLLTDPLPHPMYWKGATTALFLVGAALAVLGFPTRRK